MFSLETVKEKLDDIQSIAGDNKVEIISVSGKEEEKKATVTIAIADIKDNNTKLMIEGRATYKLKMAGAKSVSVNFVELEEGGKVAEETILTAANRPYFIAIASGKGGVGKSTVTANLAKAMDKLGKKVAVIDADIYGPSIPGILGVASKPQQVGDKFEPATTVDGIKVMSMEYFQDPTKPVIWRGPMLGRMLDVFFNQTIWGEIDVVLLDLPPGTGDIALDVNNMVKDCKEIIVTTPHEAATHIAKRAGQMGRQLNQEILGVIENMAYLELPSGEKHYIFGQGGGETLASELETSVIGVIPMGEYPEIYEEIAIGIIEKM